MAQIQEGTIVLIHSALGGVGLAAIALAKMRGALVYGTAGSEVKRKQLRDMGCLDAFDSRSTDLFHGVMKATKGRGVDVVLNSLAGQHVDLAWSPLQQWGGIVRSERSTSLQIGPCDFLYSERISHIVLWTSIG